MAEIKIFTDFIDALGKVTDALKRAASIPKNERDRFRQVMADNYRLIDTTLNMIIIRLGDILLPTKEPSFVQEVESLDNFGSWMQAEREFRLCGSLRAALREMQSFSGDFKARVSVRDIDALISIMEGTTAVEHDVADFISTRFRDLADAARVPGCDSARLRQGIKTFRNSLLNERQLLIQNEIKLYSIV